MITSNILQRVFFVRYGDATGTAFTIEVNEIQYLISAKHIFKGFTTQGNIHILHENERKEILVDPVFCEQNSIDIIGFKLLQDISPRLEVMPTSKEMYLSQDIYFLGFPYGFSSPDFALNRGFPFPIVKKGILSSLGIKDGDGNNILLFDGHNNKGFSGGPVVFIKYGDQKMCICGVISGYCIDVKDDDQENKENSGLFYGYSIDYIVDALSKLDNN